MFKRVNQQKPSFKKSIASAQESATEGPVNGFSKLHSFPPPPLQLFTSKANGENSDSGNELLNTNDSTIEENGYSSWGKSLEKDIQGPSASWGKQPVDQSLPSDHTVQLKNGDAKKAPAEKVAPGGKIDPAAAKGGPAPKAPPVPKKSPQEIKAQKQLDKFKGQSFTWPNYKTNNGWSVGKFDFKYNPSTNQATVDMKVKFTFPDIKGGKFSQAIQKFIYEANYVSQAQKAWSGRYQFKNVKEPQSVWGKLSPVNVKVNVLPVKANQHFLLKLNLHTAGTANVAPGHVTELFKKDHSPNPAFNPATTTGEEKRAKEALRRPIYFTSNSTTLRSRDKRRLNFYAAYMRRINTPKFNINLKGHSNKAGDPADNQKLSEERLKAVHDHLKSAGLTNHNYVTSAVGDAGANKSWRWRKVSVNAKVPAGFTNIQDVTPHEFGHMLGLDDEYVYSKAGRRIDHYGLVRKAFGRKFAQLVGKQSDVDSASIMQGGNEVRIHHYVTIWDALVQTTRSKANMVRPRFGYRDWKFIE